MSQEEVVKKAMIDEEDDEIEARFEVLGAFSAADDVEFSKKRVVRLQFEAYMTVLKTNDAKMMFLAMVNTMRLTLLISCSN